ncbi:MAG: DUF4129 domain-containing protein [Deltaproteobacteria bacterium]|jgi:hypothetical protein|nr:DUF4129 domain-containing protein [Deltaproteobacteria bacterium]
MPAFFGADKDRRQSEKTMPAVCSPPSPAVSGVAIRPALGLAGAFFFAWLLFGAAALQPAAAKAEEPDVAFRKVAAELNLQTEPEVFEKLDSDDAYSAIKLPSLFLAAPLALGLLLLLAALIRNSRSRIPKSARPPAGAPKPAARPVDLSAVGETADALALQGSYAEAMHALLLGAIEELKKRRGLAFPPALTSREIAAGLDLDQKAKAALTSLVAAVEICWFGSRRPGPEEWLTSQRRFNELAASLSPAARGGRGEAAPTATGSA